MYVHGCVVNTLWKFMDYCDYFLLINNCRLNDFRLIRLAIGGSIENIVNWLRVVWFELSALRLNKLQEYHYIEIVAYCCWAWIKRQKSFVILLGKQCLCHSERGLYFMWNENCMVWSKLHTAYGILNEIYILSQLFIDFEYIRIASFRPEFSQALCMSDGKCSSETVAFLEIYAISFDRSTYWGGKPNNQKSISIRIFLSADGSLSLSLSLQKLGK